MKLLLLLALGLACVLGATAPCARASSPSNDAIAREMETVLAAPEFATITVEQQLRYRGGPLDLDVEWLRDDGEPSALLAAIAALGPMLARLAEFALWTLLVAGVGLAIWFRDRWRRPPVARTTMRPAAPTTTAVHRAADAREALPADIPGEARALLRAGDERAALGLLYRGALASLRARDQLSLPDSATEADCVRVVRAASRDEVAACFEELTHSWLRAAYAGRAPERAEAEALCTRWRACF